VADGKGDAAIGREAEGSDFLVDILDWLVDILGASVRNEKAA
jgi:hypothetical protein